MKTTDTENTVNTMNNESAKAFAVYTTESGCKFYALSLIDSEDGSEFIEIRRSGVRGGRSLYLVDSLDYSAYLKADNDGLKVTKFSALLDTVINNYRFETNKAIKKALREYIDYIKELIRQDNEPAQETAKNDVNDFRGLDWVAFAKAIQEGIKFYDDINKDLDRLEGKINELSEDLKSIDKGVNELKNMIENRAQEDLEPVQDPEPVQDENRANILNLIQEDKNNNGIIKAFTESYKGVIYTAIHRINKSNEVIFELYRNTARPEGVEFVNGVNYTENEQYWQSEGMKKYKTLSQCALDVIYREYQQIHFTAPASIALRNLYNTVKNYFHE